jgi:ribonuclease Y
MIWRQSHVDFIWIALALVIGIVIGVLPYLMSTLLRKSAQRKASQLLDDAKRRANEVVKEAELGTKEEMIRRKEKMDAEVQDAKKEMRTWEKRLSKREDSLDNKVDILNKKERFIERAETDLKNRTKRLKDKEAELDRVIEEQRDALHKVSGLSREEAQRMLLEKLEKELDREISAVISKKVEHAREEADLKARTIIATAIQRVAAEHTQEIVVSTIDLPNDEMKGRVIGREGRNIRAFEKATGIDLIVDDTPGVVVVSGFDSVRREMARRALEKLIADGRIHPARIEEVVESTKKEMNELIMNTGKQTAVELDVHGLHPREIMLLGRLRFRTSYGQNVLKHSTEVAHLSSIIAAELGLDVKLAKRCGLLHDIGKAVDHEVEGGHQQIGADLARRYKEVPEVINAIAAHHEDVPVTSPYAVIVQAADAISASRPGARRETLEKYIKRLERLEAVATSFEGVRNAYAIQAGREIRIMVDPERVDDAGAARLARDIAMRIEAELAYSGEIRVTLMRETRIVEYAR